MRRWLAGARPRTLPASIVPVVVGTAAAHERIAWRAGAALVVSVAIQVGTNYINDWADGVRGTDAARVGPVRLVASGLATPMAVRRAATIAFGVAGVAGLALAAAAGWWLLALGAACIAAGWCYTAGPRPYGYAGLGEVFVFVFFGLVATAGTAYVQDGRLRALPVVAGVPVGLLGCALLVTNNLRDIPTDALTGKRTLAVRLGEARTRALYRALTVAPFILLAALAPARPWTLLALAALPLVPRIDADVHGPALVPVLQRTARLQLAYGALLAIGLAR